MTGFPVSGGKVGAGEGRERFVIDQTSYVIEAAEGGKFRVWRSGCLIYTADDIADARKMLHTYACNQLRAEIGSYSTIVNNAQHALERLGSDAFCLGRFLR